MAKRPIQEQFGERLILAFTEFARTDLKSVDELEKEEFSHISEPDLRRHLARVFYGARWIYKLGLALLVTDVERAAHVRAQLIDYGAIVEAVLSDAVRHAIHQNHTEGSGWKFRDPDKQSQPLKWDRAKPERLLQKQSFWWLIRISFEFGITNERLRERMEVLREARNGVHLKQALGSKAYLDQSRDAYQLVHDVLKATRTWRANHA